MTWDKIWQITSNLEKEQVFADINRNTKMSMQKSRRKSITLKCCSHPCAECCKELMMFGSEHNTNNLITSHSGTIRNLHPANNFPHSQRLFSYFHLDYPRSELLSSCWRGGHICFIDVLLHLASSWQSGWNSVCYGRLNIENI